jgi:peptide/nickel transport system substrate-binding protein
VTSRGAPKRRAQNLRVGGIALALTLLASTAAACSTSGGPTGTAGATGTSSSPLTVGLAEYPETLDPQLQDDEYERDLQLENIYETLLTRNQKGDLIPLLATALPKAIGKTAWQFQLRRGVTFTDKEPFNAADVVYSIKRIINPQFHSGQGNFIFDITGAKAVGPYTVDILTNGFDAVLPAQMTKLAMVPVKYSQTPKFTELPVGTGPYIMTKYLQGQYADLVANKSYWGKQPSVKSVIVKFISDENTRLAALKTGQIQFMDPLEAQDVSQVPKALSLPGLDNQIIILDTESGVTADKNVRIAMNLAVDKDTIAKDVFAGAATPSKCQIIAPGALGYDPNLTAYPYNPTKAKQLIQSAGATGKTIDLMYTTDSADLDGMELSEVLASDWQAIGLKVKIEGLPILQYKTEGIEPPTGKRPNAVDTPATTDLLDASVQYTTYVIPGPDGYSVYNNPEVNKLGTDALETPNPAQRQKDYSQAESLICSDAAFVFIANLKDDYGMAKDINYAPTPDSDMPLSAITINK